MPRSTRIVHAAAALALVLPVASAEATGWQPAVPLPGTAATAPGAPQVEAAPAGAVTAAWTAGGIVRVADRTVDGGFGAPRAVSAGGVQSDPVLAVGPGGRAVLAWVRGGLLEASVRGSAEAPFDTPTPVSGAGPSDVSAAVGADGRVAVAWVRGSLVQVAERTAVQTDWPATPHTFTEDRPGFTAVAAAPDGRLTAVWSAFDGIVPKQRSASKPAGGTWSAPATGADVALDTMGPVPVFAASDDSGAVTALWTSRTGAGSDGFSTGHPVVTAGRSVGAGALTSGPVSDGPTNEGGSPPVPALAVAGSGDAAAVWTRLDPADDQGATPEIALRAGSAGAWGAPRALESAPLADPLARPDVALDPAGRPVAVWERRDGTIAGDRSAGGWAGPQAISAAGASAPQVAVDAVGNGVAVWLRAGGLETATYETRPGVGDPHEAHDPPVQQPAQPGAPQAPAPSSPRTTAPDRPRPARATLSRLTLAPKVVRANRKAKLTLTTSATTTLTVTVQRRATRRTWRTTRRLTKRVAAGRTTLTLPASALRAKGAYRLTVSAPAATALTRSFRVR